MLDDERYDIDIPIWNLPPVTTKLHFCWRFGGRQSALFMLIREYWEDNDVVYATIIYKTTQPFTWSW